MRQHTKEYNETVYEEYGKIQENLTKHCPKNTFTQNKQ